MKVVIFLMLFALSINANGLKWLNSMEKAFEVAKKSHKPIMIFVEAEHCPWCKKMLYKTLGSRDTIKVLNRDYVLVKLDADSKEGENYFPDTFITPTIYFVSYKKEPLVVIKGFVEEEIFYMYLADVDKRVKELGYK